MRAQPRGRLFNRTPKRTLNREYRKWWSYYWRAGVLWRRMVALEARPRSGPRRRRR